jgi:hypothetical protein
MIGHAGTFRGCSRIRAGNRREAGPRRDRRSGPQLFGSGELNLRVSGETEQLVLESSLKLLQFDLTPDQARQEVRDAEAAASVRLDPGAITIAVGIADTSNAPIETSVLGAAWHARESRFEIAPFTSPPSQSSSTAPRVTLRYT